MEQVIIGLVSIQLVGVYFLERARRRDHANLRKEMNALRVELKGDIGGVRDELKKEFKEEISKVRDELKGDIAGVRDELKGDIAGVRDELKGDIAGVRGELKGDIAGVRGELKDLRDELKKDMGEGSTALGQRIDTLTKSVIDLAKSAGVVKGRTDVLAAAPEAARERSPVSVAPATGAP